jgi:Tfp pilus assembly protein PilP
MRIVSLLLVLAAGAAFVPRTAAQGVPAVVAPAGQPPAAPAAPVEAAAYSYEPDGRRDPFMSLIGAGSEPSLPSQRAEGPEGLLVSEVSVRGVLQSKNEYLAMVQGPDNKTYVIHQGDKFLDGVVKSVTAQGLVIVQDVNDPLSLVKQREVRKLLRSQEDSK